MSASKDSPPSGSRGGEGRRSSDKNKGDVSVQIPGSALSLEQTWGALGQGLGVSPGSSQPPSPDLIEHSQKYDLENNRFKLKS